MKIIIIIIMKVLGYVILFLVKMYILMIVAYCNRRNYFKKYSRKTKKFLLNKINAAVVVIICVYFNSFHFKKSMSDCIGILFKIILQQFQFRQQQQHTNSYNINTSTTPYNIYYLWPLVFWLEFNLYWNCCTFRVKLKEN